MNAVQGSIGVPLALHGVTSTAKYNGVFEVRFERDTLPAKELPAAFGTYTTDGLLWSQLKIVSARARAARARRLACACVACAHAQWLALIRSGARQETARLPSSGAACNTVADGRSVVRVCHRRAIGTRTSSSQPPSTA
jgi:hypothetical protein